MAHESDPRELGRRMADDVHQVLNGTKPGDIPIYQPTKFEFLINLKAAKALGSPSRIKRTPVILLTPYPTLTLLEELGYVTVSTGESAKKLHEITTEGRAFLDSNRLTVDALFTRMGEISRAHGGGTAPQILRAMENLKLALRLRLSRGPLNEEQINAAAALIDAAATGVEQIT